ncbi:MAG: sigma-54 dependent transcriptional regulator [Syntrophobacteraceae bacterium]|jgi:two-component system NtrC family response regulator|nr:sigma-54 dependent transcriptional regulator [Syntrophobacteraceae bacterium]
METLLIIDDEKNYLLVLEDLLAEEGYEVITAESAEQGLEIVRSSDLDVVITDMKMPGMDGMTLLEHCHAEKPDLPLIMMTAFGSVEKAVEAMRKGAFDYILKPFKNQELKLTIRKAADHHQLLRRNRYLTQTLEGRYQFSNIIGKSVQMLRIFELIEKVAPAKATVLVTGESGTGKELIARAIHFNSARKDQPFISVNCGALPENLLESELFGHERGSFTGAVSQRKGRFELAHGGTLFLDEISEMSTPLQVKLLRVLQEMEFERVGGAHTLKVDVRVVAASNRILRAEVDQGRFRSDLFYRLNVVHVHVPPLRERVDDIPLLVNHFLTKCAQDRAQPMRIDPEAMRCLIEYGWPGNVRELENVIERSVILSDGEVILLKDLPQELRQPLPLVERGAMTPPDGIDSAGDLGRLAALGFDDFPVEGGLRPRQMRALDFVRNNGFITNRHYSKLSDISERQALRELSEMVDQGMLHRVGKGRACRYVLGDG